MLTIWTISESSECSQIQSCPPYYQDILEWTGSHKGEYQNGKMRCLEMNNRNHWKCLTRWTFDAVAKHNIGFVERSFISSSHKLSSKLTTLQLSLPFTEDAYHPCSNLTLHWHLTKTLPSGRRESQPLTSP